MRRRSSRSRDTRTSKRDSDSDRTSEGSFRASHGQLSRRPAEGMPAPEAIFRPVLSGEAVAILVLIENSQAMVQNWSDLHDHHLPTLLGTMRLANSIVPVSRQGVDY